LDSGFLGPSDALGADRRLPHRGYSQFVQFLRQQSQQLLPAHRGPCRTQVGVVGRVVPDDEVGRCHAVSAGRYARWSARYALVVARDYDTQLLESVAVRRARMREALLWGRTRRRLSTVDNAKRFLISGIVAAVVCAGCVGWSFLQHALASQASSSPVPTQPSGVAAPPSAPPPTHPSGIVVPPSSPVPPPAPPSSVDPATTVRAFFGAINARDYHRA